MHRFLSTASLALIAAHALALLGDRVVRFDLLDVTVPFFSRYRSAAVGVGTVAAYAIVVVHASFALRQRLGARAWRALHKLSFLAFAAATAHGLWAGSDARRPWMLGMYLLASGVVGALLAVRLRGLASGAARGRSARA
jgi:sulfoxide reductase heme-binding subunit YedZ